MIQAPDSSFDRPNASQAQAGYRAWGGYIATMPGVGLAAPWSRADFQVVQDAGLRAHAYASGWDDPEAVKRLAADWRVLLLLDCEDGIRGDGPWVPDWLQRSGAGLYGPCSVHYHAAPFRVVARYPNVLPPAATWDPQCSAPPAEPHGWQVKGTHTDPVTGLSIDLSWMDAFFGTETIAVPVPPSGPAFAGGNMVGLSFRPGGAKGTPASPVGNRWDIAWLYPTNDGGFSAMHSWLEDGMEVNRMPLQELGGRMTPEYGISCCWDPSGGTLKFQCVGDGGGIFVLDLSWPSMQVTSWYPLGNEHGQFVPVHLPQR